MDRPYTYFRVNYIPKGTLVCPKTHVNSIFFCMLSRGVPSFPLFGGITATPLFQTLPCRVHYIQTHTTSSNVTCCYMFPGTRPAGLYRALVTWHAFIISRKSHCRKFDLIHILISVCVCVFTVTVCCWPLSRQPAVPLWKELRAHSVCVCTTTIIFTATTTTTTTIITTTTTTTITTIKRLDKKNNSYISPLLY